MLLWYGNEPNNVVLLPPANPAAYPSILVIPVNDWAALALLTAILVVPKLNELVV